MFKRDYAPERVMALHDWMQLIDATKDNPLGFNPTLLAMKAYAPYHHLFAVSAFFALGSNKSDRVPQTAGERRPHLSSAEISVVDGRCGLLRPACGKRLSRPIIWAVGLGHERDG